MAKKVNVQEMIERRANGDTVLYNILRAAAAFRGRGWWGVVRPASRGDIVDGVDMYAVGANSSHHWWVGTDETFTYIYVNGEDDYDETLRRPVGHPRVIRIAKHDPWGYVGHF